MNNKVMFSSKRDEWETPQKFFDRLNEKYHFTLDACAIPENAKCERYFTPAQNGLRQKWEGSVWCNPPYGREIGKWIEKAYTSALDGNAQVVMLLPSRTDTSWFHEYIYGKAEIIFIKGRLKFGEAKNSAPFPSIVVVFPKNVEERGDMRPAAEEIVKALRCSSTVHDHETNCAKCAYYKKEKPLAGYEDLPAEFCCQCDCDKIGLDAADLIEEMMG